MNEHLQYSPDQRHRGLLLPTLVPLETMFSAGFNYYETSLLLNDENGKHEVHLAHQSLFDKELNIVIVDTWRERKTGPYHVWSFGTFEGPASGKCKTEEVKDFVNQVWKIIRQNRIAGSTLKDRLQKVIDGFQYY